MTFGSTRRQPFLTFAFLAAFLLINAQVMQVAGWTIAIVYTAWQLITRSNGLAIPVDLGRILILPFLLLLTGLHGFLDHSLSDYAKDCWYFVAPITYIAFGYLVAERVADVKHLVYVFSLIGVFVSLQSLFNIYQHGDLLRNAVSAEDYRHVIGIGAGQAMIPVVLIVICRQAKIGLGVLDDYPWLSYFVMSVGALSILLALSRTLLSMLILGIVVGGARKFLIYTVLALGIGMMLPQTSAILDSAASQSFFDKFSRVGSEVELHPYSSMADINENWRGFEGYKALQTYNYLSPLEQGFGGGFGTLVNLGFSMNLGGSTEIEEIPILHNGYLYLLVKTGIVGLLVFLVFIGRLLVQGRSMRLEGIGEARLCGNLYLWSALSFLLTQGVITGIYNKGVLAPNLVVLGIASAIYSARKQKTALASAIIRSAPGEGPKWHTLSTMLPVEVGRSL